MTNPAHMLYSLIPNRLRAPYPSGSVRLPVPSDGLCITKSLFYRVVTLFQYLNFRPSLGRSGLQPRQAPQHLPASGSVPVLPSTPYRAHRPELPSLLRRPFLATSPHHCLGLRLTLTLFHDTGQASPVNSTAPCTIDRPQAVIQLTGVSGFALFCNLPLYAAESGSLAYVHGASYGFLQTPTLAVDALASSDCLPSRGDSTFFSGRLRSAGKQKKEPEGSFFFDYRSWSESTPHARSPQGCRSELICTRGCSRYCGADCSSGTYQADVTTCHSHTGFPNVYTMQLRRQLNRQWPSPTRTECHDSRSDQPE